MPEMFSILDAFTWWFISLLLKELQVKGEDLLPAQVLLLE